MRRDCTGSCGIADHLQNDPCDAASTFDSGVCSTRPRFEPHRRAVDAILAFWDTVARSGFFHIAFPLALGVYGLAQALLLLLALLSVAGFKRAPYDPVKSFEGVQCRWQSYPVEGIGVIEVSRSGCCLFESVEACLLEQ
jgi:hypothetical protein